MRYLRVRNLERYQHYKERNPSWVKLYPSLFQDHDLCQLGANERLACVGMLILASQTDNRIPHDAFWIQQSLHLPAVPDLASIVESGFCEDASNLLATCMQPASPEKRREREERESEIRSSAVRQQGRVRPSPPSQPPGREPTGPALPTTFNSFPGNGTGVSEEDRKRQIQALVASARKGARLAGRR